MLREDDNRGFHLLDQHYSMCLPHVSMLFRSGWQLFQFSSHATDLTRTRLLEEIGSFKMRKSKGAKQKR